MVFLWRNKRIYSNKAKEQVILAPGLQKTVNAGNRMQGQCKVFTDNKKEKKKWTQQTILENTDKMSPKNSSFLKEFISIRYKAALSKHSKSVLANCVFIHGKVAPNSRSMTSGGCLERSHLFVHTSFCLCKIWKGYLPPTFQLQTNVTVLMVVPTVKFSYLC